MPEHALVSPSPELPQPVVFQRRQQRTAKSSAAPRLSVVIVNYCQWENTAALTRQILRSRPGRQGAVEVIIVDNRSPPHPLPAQMRRWPGVSLRCWKKNRGFACAVNEGCRLSRGRCFLLLNPDMTLTERFLEGVLAMADQLPHDDPKAGIVGFQLLNNDGSKQLSTGRFPTLTGTLAGLLRPRARRKYRVPPREGRCQVPWVSGCCLLVRRECFEQLSGLDESFFLYYEDVDLCRRARAQGWSVWFEPGLRAVHRDPIHGRTVAPELRMLTRHSLLTYGRRHWPGWQLGLLAGIVRAEARARGMWARWRGDSKGLGIFTEVGRMAYELWKGNGIAARKRVRLVLSTRATIDSHPQLPSG
jgi:N-acetylglucosaminyl-diphospho-decaprenol L-rhamnosyltransferase